MLVLKERQAERSRALENNSIRVFFPLIPNAPCMDDLHEWLRFMVNV